MAEKNIFENSTTISELRGRMELMVSLCCVLRGPQSGIFRNLCRIASGITSLCPIYFFRSFLPSIFCIQRQTSLTQVRKAKMNPDLPLGDKRTLPWGSVSLY